MDENLNEEVKKLVEALNDLKEATDPLAESQNAVSGAANKSKDKLEDLARESLRTVVAMGAFSKAMISADEGTGKYAAGIGSAANAASGFAGELGILGKGVGFLISAFGGLVGGVLKQNEALAKTYKGLTNIGDLGNADWKQLAQDIQSVGLSVDEGSATYTKIIQDNAKYLTSFGGTVEGGRKSLLKLGQDGITPFEFMLKRLGYDAEDTLRHGAFWLGLVASTGQKSKLSQEDITKGSREYLTILAELTSITGQTKDQTEQKILADQNDLRYQMALSEIRDPKEAQRLQMFVANSGDAAEGLKSIIANAGASIDDIAVYADMTYGANNLRRIINAAKLPAEQAQLEFAEALKAAGKQYITTTKTFSTSISPVKDGMKDLGLAGKGLVEANQWANINTKEYAAQLGKHNKDSENQYQDEYTQQGRTQRLVRNAYEKFELILRDGINPALEKFQKTVLNLGKTFADLLYKFGGPDLRALFVDMSDLDQVNELIISMKEDVDAYDKEINKLKADREALSTTPLGKNLNAKDIAEIDKKIADLERKKRESETNQSPLEQKLANESIVKNGGASPVIPDTLRAKENYGNGPITPALQNTLNQLAKIIPGAVITSLNDAETFRDKQGKMSHVATMSGHGRGTDVDFTVPENTVWTNPEDNIAYPITPGSVGEKKLLDYLKKNGFDPNKTMIEEEGQKGENDSISTGHHFHARAPGARSGGVFDGPTTGYQVELHGKEAVVPMSYFNNFHKEMKDNSSSQSQVTKNNLSDFVQSSSGSNSNELIRIFSDMMEMMSDKFDDMISEQRKVLDVNEQILTQARH